MRLGGGRGVCNTANSTGGGSERRGVLPEVSWEGGGTSWIRDVLQKAERDSGRQSETVMKVSIVLFARSIEQGEGAQRRLDASLLGARAP
jgi:hypothetical protein